MPYIYQTFSSGQVFTKGQAQQVEDNVRDHVHGRDGLGAAGMSFNPSSATSTFTVTQTNAAQNIDCSGAFQVNFNSAATLGSSFGAGFTNIGSGRVVLAAAAGQFIGPSSLFVLTPGEFVGVGSDGARLKLFGKTTGEFLLHEELFTGSTAFIRTTQFPWFNDFDQFRATFDLTVSSLIVTAASVAVIQWSNTSGTNFATTGYVEYSPSLGTLVTTRAGVILSTLTGASPGVLQDFSTSVVFRRGTGAIPSSQAMLVAVVDGFTRSASVADVTYITAHTMLGNTGSASSIAINPNAFRLHTGATAAYITNGSIRVWGKR